MTDLVPSVDTLRGVQTPNPAGDARRTAEVAREFEATFIAQMLRPMFEGLSTDGPFGGGAGESTWRSFLIDAMAEQVARGGGIGLADHVQRELIAMQSTQIMPVEAV